MNNTFTSFLLDATKSKSAKKEETIQSLWSGYGSIIRYKLEGTDMDSVIVKHIAPIKDLEHPRGWNTNHAHLRKIKSYEVETAWYQSWNSHVKGISRTPDCMGVFEKEGERWIVLEDLDSSFPLRKEKLTITEVKPCLAWLAKFHAAHMNRKPVGLWPIGTYWHLETRQDEWSQMKNSELKTKAHLIDQKLKECKYQTIVHGDAKVANFCFSEDGKSAAAVDFQYVGGGCGMKDVAYFLGSCLESNGLKTHETDLLNDYFKYLRTALLAQQWEGDVDELMEEWRGLYPYACADFTRFLLGWMPSHQKINDYQLTMVDKVLFKH
jgi:hypothetical protein